MGTEFFWEGGENRVRQWWWLYNLVNVLTTTESYPFIKGVNFMGYELYFNKQHKTKLLAEYLC